MAEEKTKKAIDLDKILQSGRDLYDKIPDVISISPCIDFGLSGGIPKGVWVVLSGPAKAGKTSLSLRIAACCQKVGMKDVYYIDAEGRFKTMNIRGTPGLDVDNFFLVRSTIDKIYTGEELVEIAIQLIKDKPNSVFILDSASALCPEGEMNSDVAANARLSTPKLLATFFRRVGTILPPTESIFIVIQHVIANTSGYGASTMEDGGNKIKYQADVRMRCKRVEPWTDGPKQIGQLLTWEVEASALGPPHIPTQSYLRYGIGIDVVQELVNMASDLALINKGGAWYSFYTEKKAKEKGQPPEIIKSPMLDDENFLKYCSEKQLDPMELKFQGEHRIREFIGEHPQLYDIINEKLRSML
jgi:recombination protein RecA